MRTGSQRGGWGTPAAGRKTQSLTGSVTAPGSFFLDPALSPLPPRQCLSLPRACRLPSSFSLSHVTWAISESLYACLVDIEGAVLQVRKGPLKLVSAPQVPQPGPTLGPTELTPSNKGRAGLPGPLGHRAVPASLMGGDWLRCSVDDGR